VTRPMLRGRPGDVSRQAQTASNVGSLGCVVDETRDRLALAGDATGRVSLERWVWHARGEASCRVDHLFACIEGRTSPRGRRVLARCLLL